MKKNVAKSTSQDVAKVDIYKYRFYSCIDWLFQRVCLRTTNLMLFILVEKFLLLLSYKIPPSKQSKFITSLSSKKVSKLMNHNILLVYHN